MRKRVSKYFVITIIFAFLLSACSNNINAPENSLHTEENLKINGGKTLEEAMDYYLWEIEPSMGRRGNFFTGRYRIIDTLETSSSVTVYAWVISTWVDTNGNTVSDGSSLCEIGFKKEDNLYIYENYYDIKVPEFPYVPQKGKRKIIPTLIKAGYLNYLFFNRQLSGKVSDHGNS
ncbi:hypothetical protein [Candidatus Contubernalis alkaliaceticus]|uniref:hypothetical protein n=1 Tax=Candidatus Contubernalis alkaliaceticus TaxID=338645 RepID=UPI001F4C00F0|nr:hypothetical protein [Candidatus Contubernalis alkalaceticus]UNC91078.1 hypothetical protein HUE98_02640 [Candidatus Contubernalis alkalaceticus]